MKNGKLKQRLINILKVIILVGVIFGIGYFIFTANRV